MSFDSRSLSQEHFLVEFARRVESGASNRSAIHIHLSKLRPENRQRFHLRVAAQSMKSLVDRRHGQIYALGDGDLVVDVRKAEAAEIRQSIDALRMLFAEDPLAGGSTANEHGRFATIYDLGSEAVAFRAVAERLYAIAHKRVSEANTRGHSTRAPEPLTAEHMPRLLNAVNAADVSAILRRQAICVYVGERPPEPVLWEVQVDADELGRQLMPDIDLTNSRWYRYAIKEAALNRLMVWLNHRNFNSRSEPISVDVSFAGLMSDHFLAFDSALSDQARNRVVFEFQEFDVFSNLGAFVFAREMLHARSYRVALDGLNHLTLPLIDRTRLKVDLVKLQWGPDFEHDVNPDRRTELGDAIEEIGATRIVLTGCETARALECGRALGITMFQGPYIDNTLRASADIKRRSIA